MWDKATLTYNTEHDYTYTTNDSVVDEVKEVYSYNIDDAEHFEISAQGESIRVRQ